MPTGAANRVNPVPYGESRVAMTSRFLVHPAAHLDFNEALDGGSTLGQHQPLLGVHHLHTCHQTQSSREMHGLQQWEQHGGATCIHPTLQKHA
jgi:hypothetical protein